MKKSPPIFRKNLKNRGLTLLEMMVGLGLFGLIFLGAFQIMGLGLQQANQFTRSARAVTIVSEAVNILNIIMPQVVYVRSVGCRGLADGTNFKATQAEATWDPANFWYDPVIDGTHSGGGAQALIFDADFDNYFGGTDTTASVDETTTSYITNTLSAGGNYGCASVSTLNNVEPRGCLNRIRLIYVAPQNEAGATPSEPGVLSVRISSVSAPGTYTETLIGDSNYTGTINTKRQVGLVRLSCGLTQSASGTLSNEFVLNLRLKFKNSYVSTVSDSRYSSWHPNGSNYGIGNFREISLKFAFPNLKQRGVYQWKMQSLVNCGYVGENVGVGNRARCCSNAIDAGGSCVICIDSGSAGTADSCCSGKVSGGNCI